MDNKQLTRVTKKKNPRDKTVAPTMAVGTPEQQTHHRSTGNPSADMQAQENDKTTDEKASPVGGIIRNELSAIMRQQLPLPKTMTADNDKQ